MTDSILSIKGLYKRYGKIEAVKNLNIDVKRGEVVGFLGLNGAGKTTTLKVCAGTLRPTSGKIFIDGYDLINHPTEAKLQLGYVPDDPFLYENLTGREFVRFIAGLYTKLPDNIEVRIEEFFYLFDMEDQMDELIKSYSRGMRQKTALISALIHNPNLLLCDEPASNLDPYSAKVVKEIFEGYKKRGKGVFMSTHVVESVESFCDRIAIIHKGKLLAFGSPKNLLNVSRKARNLEEVFIELTGAESGKDKSKSIKNLLAKLSDREVDSNDL